MISTVDDGFKDSVVAKTERVLRGRLEEIGCALSFHSTCAHETETLAKALKESDAEIVVVFGATAMSDEDDVIPAAIRRAGGRVDAIGMPVDPGNLICVGHIGERSIVGAPGCARSPAENGFDWVLWRLVAGVPVRQDVLMEWGVGGLLMDTTRRTAASEIGIVVLGAGQSRRMGRRNKLLEEVNGAPMISRVVDAAISSELGPVMMVLGHEAEKVRASIPDGVKTVTNHAHAEGMGTSVAAGVRALGGDHALAGVMVCLGDMPHLRARDLRSLGHRFRAMGESRIVAAAGEGRRGNPVIFPAARFAELASLSGDAGARDLLHERMVEIVELGRAATRDYDTAEDFERE